MTGDGYTGDRPKGRKIGIIVSVIVLLLILIFLGYRYWLDKQVAARLDAIRKAGYPVTLSELDAWYKVPRGENAAAHIGLASRYYVYEHAKDNRYEQLPVVGEGLLPARDKPLSEEVRRLVREYLDDNQEALGYLHQAAAVKESRYPIVCQMGHGMLLPHLNEVRHGVRLLQLEALLAVETGETETPIPAMQASFGLVRSLKGEPVLISYLVAIACVENNVTAVEEVLNRTRLNDADLVVLEKMIREAMIPGHLERAMAGERCMGSSAFQLPIPQLASILAGQGGFPYRLGTTVFMVGYSWSGGLDLDHLAFLDIMDEMVTSATLPITSELERAEPIDDNSRNLSKMSIMTRMMVPAWQAVGTKEARKLARLETAATAVALERFRLKHDRTPQTLKSLVPAFLSAIPEDPFDGQPLRYRKLDEGYLIYSIGDDRKDDGGDESGRTSSGRRKPAKDIVFKVLR